MVVVATLLFGSLARADHSEGSDTDLLMVSLDKDTRHVSVGHLSLFLYPWHQLEQDARAGDLFVCHLAREAKPLIDPDNYLAKLQSAFQFRSSYQGEIDRARDLGMYLVRFGNEFNSTLLTKRALWCIRTILIARSAERRDPLFAPQRLAENTQSAAARDLLTNRHIHRESAAVRERLRSFLEEETRSNGILEAADREHFLERFDATSNKVALQTLRQEQQSRVGYFG
ncbi:MAG: hypothetical protein ACOY91_22135 [Pseudomonadota bacterium]